MSAPLMGEFSLPLDMILLALFGLVAILLALRLGCVVGRLAIRPPGGRDA
jgi:hypothetical protein